jgi:peptidoglycan/xylan/chitin deacetylase (PgdA/CDA1 family)
MLSNKSKKKFILVLGKYLGLFYLARLRTRKELRIVCYHGTSIANEADFRPDLFIASATLEQRLQYIVRKGFNVLSLEDAVVRLRNGTLPSNAVVITIDDGFYGTYKEALHLLKKYQLPATLYVTTYYSQHQNPIFRLLVQYIFWATENRSLNLNELGIEGFRGEEAVSDRPDDATMWRIIDYGEIRLDEPGRRHLASRLATLLQVDLEELEKNRYLGLMSEEEIREASKAGIDVQLHTHRHRFPVDEMSAKREIVDNRAVLEPLVGKRLRHLCYPSGFWSERHWAWLEDLDIQTATTCDVGLNDPRTHPLALKRIFDSSSISSLEFEAELSGYLEILRRLLSRLGRRPVVPLPAAPEQLVD